MTGHMQKVSFEHVSAITHPQWHRGDNPAVAAADVPDQYWSRVERAGADVEHQYHGLCELERSGQLIRAVRLFEAAEPDWREVTR